MFMLKARRPKTFRDNASVDHSGQTGAPLDFTVKVVSPNKGGSSGFVIHVIGGAVTIRIILGLTQRHRRHHFHLPEADVAGIGPAPAGTVDELSFVPLSKTGAELYGRF
jgi:hypothetical protein